MAHAGQATLNTPPKLRGVFGCTPPPCVAQLGRLNTSCIIDRNILIPDLDSRLFLTWRTCSSWVACLMLHVLVSQGMICCSSTRPQQRWAVLSLTRMQYTASTNTTLADAISSDNGCSKKPHTSLRKTQENAHRICIPTRSTSSTPFPAKYVLFEGTHYTCHARVSYLSPCILHHRIADLPDLVDDGGRRTAQAGGTEPKVAAAGGA